MAFSTEWEEIYRKGEQNSTWPWSEVVSCFYHYFKGDYNNLNVLELGCGAGANISFFKSLGVNYYGIEGSVTKVRELNEAFADEKTTIANGDFTKEIPFDNRFDLVLDRGSVTHNTTEDIKNTIVLVRDKLRMGGYYFGIDWFSSNPRSYDFAIEKKKVIDANTMKFQSGYFEGKGNVHFSDAQHIKELFESFSIIELFMKTETWDIPNAKVIERWNFVARK